MSGILGHRGLLLQGEAGGAASALYDTIMALGPVNYWRNAEASGSIMVDEVADDGAYFGAVSLGNDPLYPDGATVAGGNFGPSIFGSSSVVPASLTAMTLITIVRPTALSGVRLLGVQRDESGTFGARFYQWRSNGTDMEFVKIIGGVTTITAPAVLAADNTFLLGIEIGATGNYAMYRNGAAVKTGTIAAGNYGGAGDPWRIGYATGPAANLAGKTCENAVFNKVLGPAAHAALFEASGL